MKTTGILFQADMVRAILEGRKTLTSRLSGLDRINHHPDEWTIHGSTECGIWVWNNERITATIRCRYGVPGDILIGRETWGDVIGKTVYRADRDSDYRWVSGKPYQGDFRWRPSIEMPFSRSRLQLEITQVWPSRLQDMMEEEAVQEGIETDGHLFRDYSPEGTMRFTQTPLGSYCGLWDRINVNKPGRSWSDNPWVWRIMFKRVFFPAVVVSPFASTESCQSPVGDGPPWVGEAQEDIAMKARDTLPGTLAAAGGFWRCRE